MPRNSSGNYSLPIGNPVADNTPIVTTWANPTLADIASALTDSLDRNGRGGMLGSFKVADGTAAAPGLAFSSQSSAGLYRETTNVVGIAPDGTAAAKFSDTVVTLLRPTSIPMGTVALPSLYFGTNVATGFWSPAANVIAASINGVEKMRIAATGDNIGAPSTRITGATNVGGAYAVNIAQQPQNYENFCVPGGIEAIINSNVSALAATTAGVETALRPLWGAFSSLLADLRARKIV